MDMFHGVNRIALILVSVPIPSITQANASDASPDTFAALKSVGGRRRSVGPGTVRVLAAEEGKLMGQGCGPQPHAIHQ